MGNLKHLDLSWSFGLRKSPNFGDMPKLETLILWECKTLEEIHSSLGHCRMLTYLNLGHCYKLKKLPELRLSNLKHLNLSLCGGLRKTPNLGDMSSLVTLNLWKCKNLEEVHPSLGHCRMLTKVNLSGCYKLKKLPELRLSNLKHLDLSGCGGLTETPNFGDKPNLETLNLWRCSNLEEVHPSLGHCRMLTELNLGNCYKLKKLPKLRLSNLKHLNPSCCRGLIKTPNFSDMPNLEILNLNGCENLKKVHSSLGHCRMLTKLYLGDCYKLKKLPELRLSSLKHLELSRCGALAETPNFGDKPNLETLNLNGCQNLEEVHPSLGHCRMLRELDLSDCHRLKKLPEFVTMESLYILNLCRCTSLKEFPETYGDMRRLSKLYVGSPWIRSLPLSLTGLTHLVSGSGEVLESIPDAIQNLVFLEIKGCSKLATLPNSLCESQQLKSLTLCQCSGLVELPTSLGVQKKLHRLEIDGCENLKKLPSSIQMESLEELNISNCPKLDTFPESNGDMHSLKGLTIKSTGIRELPSSIRNLNGLIELNLEGCEDLVSLPNNLCNLKNLHRLFLRGCKKLEELPENIGDLQELKTLDARETAIFQPPRSITKLGKLSYLNILGGLPKDLGSLQSLKSLGVSGSNISCLPKSIKELLGLETLDVQFCLNLNELPEELPPNLEKLCADYHLALKSIRDLLNKCLKLRRLLISWCGHEKSEYGTVSSEQVNVWKSLQHLIRTCIQCDYHQRDYFLIFFPEVRIPELFNYQFINQNVISIDLNPSWYTDKFMGFSICCGPNSEILAVVVTLVCKSDPERKHSLKYNLPECTLESPVMCFIYIPFETLLHTSDDKKGKNPNDYYQFEVSSVYGHEAYWGIHLEYDNKDTAVTTKIGCSMVHEQPDLSLNSSSRSYAEHNIATDRGLYLGNENKDVKVDQAAMAVQKEHESQNVELTRVCDSPSRKMGEASRKRKRKRKGKRKRNRNKKRKIARTDETSCSYFTNKSA